jgi:hypothetical protein
MNRSMPTALILGLMTVVACHTDNPPASPIAPTASLSTSSNGSASVSSHAGLDVSGVYDWGETTILKLRPEAVALFGVAVEGPVTHIECRSSGELTLVQSPAGVTGSATQQSSCVTADGQAFVPPVFPPAWTMTGRLTGRSFSFTIDTGVFPCPYRGSVHSQGGQVVKLTATGSCEVPRELGHDKILSWRAIRQ